MSRSAAAYQKFTEDEIRKANSVDILSLARGYGYEPEKAGRKAGHGRGGADVGGLAAGRAAGVLQVDAGVVGAFRREYAFGGACAEGFRFFAPMSKCVKLTELTQIGLLLRHFSIPFHEEVRYNILVKIT